MIDLTGGYNDSLQQQLQLLVNTEDNGEECTSKRHSNWVLNKGLDSDISFFKVPDDCPLSQPKAEKGGPPFSKVE